MKINQRSFVTGLAFSLVCLSQTVNASNIWGTGEVPRITKPENVPQTLEEIWSGYEQTYDKYNPLEAKFHKTWEVDNQKIVVNWVQLTVGTFQGKKATVCGYWAYPKDAKNLPAIVNFHGGPQTASENSAINWARLGYACFHPNHNDKAKMAGEAANLPNTDWSAVDAWDLSCNPTPTTVDAVWSPRNDWQFPRQISGRRIITFLEQQPQVNKDRIGVRGHSTGGTLTTKLSIDPRVKAAVPSVGGSGGFMDVHPIITGNTRHRRLHGDRLTLFQNTLEDRTYWKKMHAPALMLGASNDFNAPDWNCIEALKGTTVDHRYTSCANYNHAFPPETMVADYLWFEDKLKGIFSYPQTPKAELLLNREDRVPLFRVIPPETDLKLKRVEIFYTDGRNPLTRFWMSGTPIQNKDGSWEMQCPVINTDEPLMAFANLIFEINPIFAPGHRYNGLEEMAVTSNYTWAWPEQLQQAQVKINQIQSRLIDDFFFGLRDWAGNLQNNYWWSILSRKIANPRFSGPKGAELVVEINAPEAGTFIGFRAWRNYMNAHISEGQFYTFLELKEKGWNTVRIKTTDLKNRFGWELDDWHKLAMIELCSAGTLKRDVEHGYKRKIDPRLIANQPKENFELKTGSVPSKVSGWDESYYSEGGEEYTNFNMVSKDDLLARQRFRNMRWEGGEYVIRTKPYEPEKYIRPKQGKN
jgi:dienelactone hydrolase